MNGNMNFHKFIIDQYLEKFSLEEIPNVLKETATYFNDLFSIEKEVKISNPSFKDIPVQVIINEIFEFVPFQPADDLSCYGYFIKERLRKIRLLFSSLVLMYNKRNYESPRVVFFDYTKIKYLKVKTGTSVMESLKNLKGRVMNQLKVLFVHVEYFSDVNFVTFLQEVEFPSLQKVIFDGCPSPPASGLKFSVLENVKVLHFPLTTIPNCEKYVNEFLMRHNFEKLEQVVLEDESFSFSRMYSMQNYKFNKEVLRVCKIKSMCVPNDYFNSEFPNLNKLNLIKVRGITGREWVFPLLESIRVSSCAKFEDVFFCNKVFSGLKKLVISDCPLITLRFNSKFPLLRHFEFKGTKEFDNVQVFKKLPFPNLKKLFISKVDKFDGVVKGMDKIEKYWIFSCRSVRDGFLEKCKLENLKDVGIKYLQNITGTGWENIIKKLEHVDVNCCPRFDIDFLEGVNFNLNETNLKTFNVRELSPFSFSTHAKLIVNLFKNETARIVDRLLEKITKIRRKLLKLRGDESLPKKVEVILKASNKYSFELNNGNCKFDSTFSDRERKDPNFQEINVRRNDNSVVQNMERLFLS